MQTIHHQLLHLTVAGAVCSLSTLTLAQAAPPSPPSSAAKAAPPSPAPLPSTHSDAAGAPNLAPAPISQAKDGTAAPASPNTAETATAPAPATQSSEEAVTAPAPAVAPPLTASGEATPTPPPSKATAPPDTANLTSPNAASYTPSPPLGLNVMLTSDSTWLNDGSYDLFSDDDTASSFGVAAELDLLHFTNELTAALGVSLMGEREHASGVLPGYLEDSELTASHLQLTATLRYALAPWFLPHLRGFGGISFVETRLETTDRTAKAETASPRFGGGAGVTFITPRGTLKGNAFSLMQFGVVAEGGFAFASPLDLDTGEVAAAPDPSEGGGRRAALRGVPLGELERSGPFLRVAGLVRF